MFEWLKLMDNTHTHYKKGVAPVSKILQKANTHLIFGKVATILEMLNVSFKEPLE